MVQSSHRFRITNAIKCDLFINDKNMAKIIAIRQIINPWKFENPCSTYLIHFQTNHKAP